MCVPLKKKVGDLHVIVVLDVNLSLLSSYVSAEASF